MISCRLFALLLLVSALFQFPVSANNDRSNDTVMAADQAGVSQFKRLFITRKDNALLEVEIGWSEGPAKAVVLFSHGANAAPERYRALTRPWVQAGFVVISPLHLDSERHPQRETDNRRRILNSRLADMEFLVNSLNEIDAFPKTILTQIVDKPLIAVGHSYGAYIAQIAGGATVLDPDEGKILTITREKEIAGIIALSPPPAFDGFSPKGSWAEITAPMLVQTGTLDILPPFVAKWQQHLDSYYDATANHKWKVVYDEVDHYFGGVIGRVSDTPDAKGKSQFGLFVELSLKFMDLAINVQRADTEFSTAVDEHSVVP